MKINVTDSDGQMTSVSCEEGSSLMEVLRAAGLPIAAICGGSCLCATCHIYVHHDWLLKLPPRSTDEQETIGEALDVRENSRLACQIRMEQLLDGIQIELAPTA